MKQKVKSLVTIVLFFFITFIVFTTWTSLAKQIKSAKGNVNSMKQLAAGFPQLFYPNYFYDLSTLAERFRKIQKKDDLYYNDNQVFRSDVLQMATAPTKIKSLELLNSKSAFVVIPKQNFKSENIRPNILHSCKQIIKGTYYSISHCENL